MTWCPAEPHCRSVLPRRAAPHRAPKYPLNINRPTHPVTPNSDQAHLHLAHQRRPHQSLPAHKQGAPNSAMVRRRNPKMQSPDETSLHTLPDNPLPPTGGPPREPDAAGPSGEEGPSAAQRWIVLAVASGACAAFNGMFAKLYVSELPLCSLASCLPCSFYGSYPLKCAVLNMCSILVGYVFIDDTNGADARRTTTELTKTIAGGVGEMLGLGSYPEAVEYIIRGVCSHPDVT